MKLSALMDYPDDARHVFFESTMYEMMKKLKGIGVSRVCLQYYGDKSYGLFWNHKAPTHREMVETAKNLPDYAKVFVEAAKAYGLETVVIMRPQEQGMWLTFSPYYEESRKYGGIPYTGGNMMITSNFLRRNPELRIKRRSYDIDPDAAARKVCKIRLFKQNNSHTRIRKEDLSLYISDDNSGYRKYKDNFSINYLHKKATGDSVTAKFLPGYPEYILTKTGDEIEVMELSDLDIKERYIAVGVSCSGDVADDRAFINTAVNIIKIYDENDEEICSSPGYASRFIPEGSDYLKVGFHFDDGLGEITAVKLDTGEKEEFAAVCKGKSEYVHGAVCACEPKVQEYWMKWLEKAMDAGFDYVGTRIECHSVHVDEPFAYGYNDCIKEEYIKRFGPCSEENMDLVKIARIRGDAYTRMLVESSRRTKERGLKFILTLNVEMLHHPIPAARRMAYPMNVEWQWERWLEETEPDEITIRSYQMTPEYILGDRRCREIVDKARERNVPLNLERYDYWDFAEDFRFVDESGIFDRMTLYETNDILRSDGKGGLVELKPELLDDLRTIMAGEGE
jgi:hypothetical protein